MILQFGNLKIENHNYSELNFHSLVSMLPRLQTRCLITFCAGHFKNLIKPPLPLPGSSHYVSLAVSRELRSELSQCVKIDRTGFAHPFFYVEALYFIIVASLSIFKSLGGVEVIHASHLRAMSQNNVHQLFQSKVILFIYR